MLKSIEISAKTEDDAISQALEQLELTRDDVSVEIVQRAKSGLFGFKSSPAIIRVLYEHKEEKSEQVDNFLKGLLQRMDINASTDITKDDSTINVIIKGDDPGAVIGRRGETLDAIQHLANYVVNRSSSGRIRVNIDSEDYRRRRNETLENLASKVAGKVVKYRRSVTLDPMNAYERHIIHAVLQENDAISTYSIGNEPNRRVVVSYGKRPGNQAKY